MNRNKMNNSVIKIFGHMAVMLSLGYGMTTRAGTANISGQYYGEYKLTMNTPLSLDYGNPAVGPAPYHILTETGLSYGVLGYNLDTARWLWNFDNHTITLGGASLIALNVMRPVFRLYSPDRAKIEEEELAPLTSELSDMIGTFVDNEDGSYTATFNFQIYFDFAGRPLTTIQTKFEINQDNNGNLEIISLDEAPEGLFGAGGQSSDGIPGRMLKTIGEGGGIFPFRVSPQWDSELMTRITTDSNSDGIADSIAIELGLSLISPDTDGDGISDIDELGTNLALPIDTDRDGVADVFEEGSAAEDKAMLDNIVLATGEKVSLTALNQEVFSPAITPQQQNGTAYAPLEPHWLGLAETRWRNTGGVTGEGLLPTENGNNKAYHYDMGTITLYHTSWNTEWDIYEGVRAPLQDLASIPDLEAQKAQLEMLGAQDLADLVQAQIDFILAKAPNALSLYNDRAVALYGNDFTNVANLEEFNTLLANLGIVVDEISDDIQFEIFFANGIPEGLKIFRLKDTWERDFDAVVTGIEDEDSGAPSLWAPTVEEMTFASNADSKTIIVTSPTFYTKNAISSMKLEDDEVPGPIMAGTGGILYQFVLAHTDANRAATLNNAPVIEGTPSTSIEENLAYSFVPTAMDDDGDVLTFSIINKPGWASFDTATGELSGTPASTDVGSTEDIVIAASDTYTSTDLPVFSLEVTKKPSSGDGNSSGGSFFWLLLPALLTFGLRTKKNKADKLV